MSELGRLPPSQRTFDQRRANVQSHVFTKSPLVRLLSACLLTLLVGCASGPPARQPYRIAQDAHGGGNALAIAPDSRLGASGGWSGNVRLWRLEDGSRIGGWNTGHGDLFGLLFLDTEHLLTTGHDGEVRVWRLDGTLQRSFTAGAAISSFRAFSDRSRILLGHADGWVSLWQVDGERLGAWPLSDERITAVALTTEPGWFAAADSAANVWRWRAGHAPVELESPPTYPRSLVFVPGSARLLGSGWFTLFVWPDGDAALTPMPTAHRGIINHLEISPDGAYLASISRQTDSSVLLLDPHSGETLQSFRKHDLCGQRVVLSPDGRRMMSNSDDASVRFYALPSAVTER
jgi:WD40 repeat protein